MSMSSDALFWGSSQEPGGVSIGKNSERLPLGSSLVGVPFAVAEVLRELGGVSSAINSERLPLAEVLRE